MSTLVVPTIINVGMGNFGLVQIDGGTQRMIPFFPFVPPPIHCYRDHYRNKTLVEWQAYYTTVMLPVPEYTSLWIAQQVYDDPKHGPSVVQGGIIYRNNNSFGIWTGSSFTMMWPVSSRPLGGLTPIVLNPGWGGVV